MATLHHGRKQRLVIVLIMHLECLNQLTLFLTNICALLLANFATRRTRKRVTWDFHSRAMIRNVNFNMIVYINDTSCIENTRMDRRSFYVLCELFKIVGSLEPIRHMCVEELVAIFLHILAHDIKNRVIKRQFTRSGEIISRQFNKVLHAVLRCHTILLKQPKAVLENSTDDRWKWYKVTLKIHINLGNVNLIIMK